MESIPLDQIEFKIYLATSPEAIKDNESKIPEAREFVKNIKDSPDGLIFCLSNFASFNNYAAKFTLEILTYWLERRFSEISQEILPDIFDFLKTTAANEITKKTPDGAEVLAETQATFTLKTYLEIFPDVIGEFFIYGDDKSTQTPSLRYIQHLFKQLTTPAPDTIELHQAIIQKMMDDGSMDAITHVLQIEIGRRGTLSTQILIYYARILDIDFLDEEFFSDLAEDLDDELRGKFVPLVYLSILQRQEDKKPFIEMINLINIFNQLIENPSYDDIVIERFGTLLSYCGYVFQDEKEFYDYAIQIGSNVAKEIAASLLNYINSFTLGHADCLESTLNFTISRLKLHYENFYQPDENSTQIVKQGNRDYDAEFVESINQVSANCFALNHEVSEQILISFLSSVQNIFEDIPALMTILSLIFSLFKSEIKIEQIDNFTQILSQMMQNTLNEPLIEAPFCDIYLAFFKIILLFDDFYPTPIVFAPNDIFRSLIPFTVTENPHQQEFQKLLIRCCFKYGSQTNIEENDLGLFMSSPDYITGKIFGSLINCVPDANRPDVVQQMIAKLQSDIKESADGNVLLFTLATLTKMKSPFEEKAFQSTFEFVQALLNDESIQNDDFLLSKAIKGMSSLKLVGTQIFLEIYPNVSTIESLTALAKFAASVRKIASLQESAIEVDIPNNDPGLQVALDNTWVPKFASFLVEQMQNFNTSVSFFEKDELGNYFDFLNSIVIFMSENLQYMQPSDVMSVANTLIDAINMYFDSPELNNAMLTFAMSLISISDQEILELLVKFVQISLNFIFTQNLPLLTLKWNEVLTNLLEFYSNLNEAIQPDFQAAFAEAAQTIGATPQSVQSFLEALSNSEQIQMIVIFDYLIDFCSELIMNRIYI